MTDKRVPTKCVCGGKLNFSEEGRQFVVNGKTVEIEDVPFYKCDTCGIGVTNDGQKLYDALKYEYERLKRLESEDADG